MRYLHTMVRVKDLTASLYFYCTQLGLQETHRIEDEAGRYTLVYLNAPADAGQAKNNHSPLLELTYNWDTEDYTSGRNFGHLAFEVDNIYSFCQNLLDKGITINRPPRDGYMAFIRSPAEPWASMQSMGVW